MRTQFRNDLTLGIGLAIVAALVSGVSVFVNGKAVREFDDASVFTTAKNLLVGGVLLLLLVRPGTTASLRAVKRANLGRLALIAAVGGSIPFIVFFEGLSSAAPANAAIIQKSMFIWVGLLAVPLLGERLGWLQAGALLLLAVAQLLVGSPSGVEVGRGEVMVFAATLLWSVEIIVARKVLPDVPLRLAATARMALGAVVLIAYLAATGRAQEVAQFSGEQAGWLFITAAMLLAYVLLWYGALKHAPATAVTSLLTIAAPITVALQVWDGRPAPVGQQLLGYGLLSLAVVMLAAVYLSGVRARLDAAPATVARSAT